MAFSTRQLTTGYPFPFQFKGNSYLIYGRSLTIIEKYKNLQNLMSSFGDENNKAFFNLCQHDISELISKPIDSKLDVENPSHLVSKNKEASYRG